MLDELRVAITYLDDWMSNVSPPWFAYYAIITCGLVVLYKIMGVKTLGIGEMIRRDLDKIILREAWYQAKTCYLNLQM